MESKDIMHTCGRCQYEAVPEDMYPCKECIYGTDTRQDLWTPKKTRHKAHWMHMIKFLDFRSDMIFCRCSECNYKVVFTGKFDGQRFVVGAKYGDYKYCPNCGADMSEDDEEWKM